MHNFFTRVHEGVRIKEHGDILPWADDIAIFCQGSAMELDVSSRVGGSGAGVNILSCSGNLDLETVDIFTGAALPLLGTDGKPLIIDLSGVDFIDSMGLSGLIAALTHARESELGLDLVVNTERVSRLLSLTGVDALLPIHESLQGALASN
jgi:anti-sigma B factor antagonist